jgi:hypothetical protein
LPTAYRPDLRDWNACVAEYRRRFADRAAPAGSWPTGLGRNFITPEVLGYVLAGAHVVEISTGTAIGGDRIYGITVARAPDEPAHALDRCVDSFDAVEEALEEIA